MAVQQRARRELVQLIKRNKYKEVLRSTVETKYLLRARVPARFLLGDAVGAGVLSVVRSGRDDILRLGPAAARVAAAAPV